MQHRALKAAAAVLATSAAVAATLGAVVAQSGEPVPAPLQRDVPSAVTRAGLDPSAAELVIRGRGDVTVSKVAGNGVRCLVISNGVSDCKDESEISAGRSLAVSNDCAAAGKPMTVSGFVPAGVDAVALRYPGGRLVRTAVESGLFHFDTATPVTPADVPVEVLFTSRGDQVKSFAFPLGTPNDFCPPIS